jgi:subtilisin family serine protease
MDKKWLIVLLGVLLVGLVFSGSSSDNSELLDKAKEEGKVKVIVTMIPDSDKGRFSTFSSEDEIEKIKEGKEVIEFTSGGFAAELSEGELLQVLDDERVVGIEPVRQFHLHLSQVKGIVNSSDSWGLQFNSLNFTGQGQTICIIDTGVNFSHPDLVGKNLTCNINCAGASCSEDCATTDLNGHGTHVAGIAAANGSIQGVAIGANLIGLKVFSGSSSSISDTTWIKNAIDWCVDNAEEYNISVISMSLGTSDYYSSACDVQYPSFSTSIGNAYNKNISVVVSTGNEANYTGIASPACIANAIPVGDTYDGNLGGLSWGDPVTCTDTTTALDKIVCHANRNSLVQLFAPGALINSTKRTGGYEERGGTSMAAPVVAGAIAMMRQMLNNTNQYKTPAQIEDVLNDTGKQIHDDETGLDFSRIDAYEAVLKLDNIGPVVNLVSPTNNLLNWTVNQTFVCNATDWQLRNATLKLWNSTALYYNISYTVSGNTSNQTAFNVNNIPVGRYTWNCEYSDVIGNFNTSSSNYTLTVGGVTTTLISPATTNYTKVNQTTFSCNSSTEENTQLVNVTFYLWNSTSLVRNETSIISGLSNLTNFTYNLTRETNYSWNCLTVNNNSNSSFADDNYTLTFDVTATNISGVSSGSVGTTGAVISWTTGESTNSTVHYGTTVSTTSRSSSSSYSTSHSITLSGLSSTTGYYYNVSSCDRAGNCNYSAQYTFTTTTPSSGNDDEGGGGGGGEDDGSKSYFPTKGELEGGYSKDLSLNDKIYVSFGSVRHSVSVASMTAKYAEVLIQSDPIRINLSIGESERLNLSSTDYYDLKVTLNDIADDTADLTVKEIHEEIRPKVNLTETERVANYTVHNETGATSDDVEPDYSAFYVGGGIFLAVVLISVGVWFGIANTKKLKVDSFTHKYGKIQKT